VIDLGPTRKIEGMVPSSTKPIDLSGFDKPRKPGFGSLLKNPAVMAAFAKMLSSPDAQPAQKSPYAGYGAGGKFDYFGG